MKLSEQNLKHAEEILSEIQVYFDILSGLLTDSVKGHLIHIADKILKSIKTKLDKYSDIPIEKRRTLNKLRKSIGIKLLYTEPILNALKQLYNNDYPADRLTDFALADIDKFYKIIK
ncbi:hypothetical protein IJ843_03635 [bacterium]|nr:hypothetical protein [bacterium]